MDRVKLAQKGLYQYGGPLLLVLGGISCVINVLVFSRKSFQKTPCSIYLVAFNIASFVLIYSSLLNGTLTAGYGIDLSAWNLTFCRLRIFISMICDGLTSYYLILASIDRVLFTSLNAATRLRSSRRLALKSILVGTVLIIPLQVHVIFFTEMTPLPSNQTTCYFRPGLYTVLISYYMFIKGVLVPVLLTFFGLWTLRNIQQLNHAVATLRTQSNLLSKKNHRSNRIRPKNQQLVRILFVDLTGYILFCSFNSIHLMYSQFTQYSVKTPQRIQIEIFVRYLCLFLHYIPYCINCYVHILISKAFRREIKQIFSIN